ncbi:MliC family protein [Trichloromonas sp.]|uniref:MliC family protein n=1 Tax=Trichloromonas sp. TaxID=3069249 RepID=UPI003D81C262
MSVPPGIFLKTILLLSVVTVTACSFPGPAPLAFSPAGGAARVYECRAGYEILARIDGEFAHLILPDRTVSLVYQPAADGARYSRGDVTFWAWDDEAMLEIGHETRMTCTLNPNRDSLR